MVLNAGRLVSRRELIALASAAVAGISRAGDALPVIREDNVLLAPDDPADWPAWRGALARWREDARKRLSYSDALYRRLDFAWVPSCFSCCFLMLYDQAFYDARRGRWTVDAFLDQQAHEFGGFDAVVLWHAYPRIGLDERNQFDFYRDMPGGIEGLRGVVRALHRRRVKAFIDYNPWDTGTRREPVDDLDSLVTMVRDLEADGIFLDTMSEGAAAFRSRLDAARPGVVLEGEGALPLERIGDHHMSWAQWFGDSAAPGVLRNKWFERRHMQHRIDRWNRDHTQELQSAWMNGSGMMVWENVFGSWVGWNPRDRSILRAMLPIQRRYASLFSGERWTPLVPTRQKGLFASLWEGDGLRLWTLVNRTESAIEGPLLRVSASPGARWFDLIAGREFRPGSDRGIGTMNVPAFGRSANHAPHGQLAAAAGEVTLAGRIGPRGIGAFLCAESESLGEGFDPFLTGQARLAARGSDDTAFPARTTRLAVQRPTPRYARDSMPAGMMPIPGGRITQQVEFRVRECGFYEAQDPRLGVSGGLPLHGPVTLYREVDLRPYAIDLAPVTNAQFAAFLTASRYRPRQDRNFLRHWRDGAPPAGTEEHPVVWVDLEDARAYSRWAGKRLPTEEEWQHAAEGPEGRLYPWGAEMVPGRCNGGESGGTTPVTAYPEGRSPFGCWDMCGNVWEWTESERSDGRTRFAILKGGSWYRAEGSAWYFDGGPQPCRFAAKMLLLWPGLDRCATIGFRCATDIGPASR